MNATNRLLDAVRLKLGLTSDNQLATHWNLTRQRISEYRRGDTSFSEERILQVAEILNLDPGPLMIEIQAERARKSGRSSVADALDALLRKLGTGIAALVALFALAPAPADAAFMPDESSALSRQHLTDNANYAH